MTTAKKKSTVKTAQRPARSTQWNTPNKVLEPVDPVGPAPSKRSKRGSRGESSSNER